eukprot:217709_1
MLWFILIIITLVSTSIASEIIHCDQQNDVHCGPCDTSNQCHLNCFGYETCKGKDQTLICKDNENCDIVCNGEINGKSCLDAAIYIENVINTTINCVSYEDCKNIKLYASNTHSLTINCMAKEDYKASESNCQDMAINAQSSESLQINCNGYHGCKKMQIICGNNCTINCNENHGHVCDGVHVTCGTGDCEINCSGFNKCPGIVINTEKATRFRCIGSENDCTAAPAPFIRNTTSYPATVQTFDSTSIHTTIHNTNSGIIKPTFQTIMSTVDRKIKKYVTTKIITEQNDNIQSEKAELFDWYVYLIIGVIFGLSCTICFAIMFLFVYDKKRRTRRACQICPCICNSYSGINYEQRMESIAQIDCNNKENIKHKVQNRLYEFHEGMENHSELDGISNIMINKDDEVLQDVDNMTVTGGYEDK